MLEPATPTSGSKIELLTPTEVAKALRIHDCCTDPERVVRRMVQRGDLVGVKVSRFLRATVQSLDSYIRGK